MFGASPALIDIRSIVSFKNSPTKERLKSMDMVEQPHTCTATARRRMPELEDRSLQNARRSRSSEHFPAISPRNARELPVFRAFPRQNPRKRAFSAGKLPGRNLRIPPKLLAVPVLPSISAQSVPEMLANSRLPSISPPESQKTCVLGRKAPRQEPSDSPKIARCFRASEHFRAMDTGNDCGPGVSRSFPAESAQLLA